MRCTSWFAFACAGAVLACAGTAASGKVVISLDYSLDGPDGMFDATTTAGRQARAAMERAAQVYSDRFVDNLTAITGGSGNSWSARIVNPGTRCQRTLHQSPPPFLDKFCEVHSNPNWLAASITSRAIGAATRPP